MPLQGMPARPGTRMRRAGGGGRRENPSRTAAEIPLDSTPVVMPSETPVEPSEPMKVIEPEPVEEAPVKRKSGGQAAIDDVMFPPILDNQPPFEI